MKQLWENMQHRSRGRLTDGQTDDQSLIYVATYIFKDNFEDQHENLTSNRLLVKNLKY